MQVQMCTWFKQQIFLYIFLKPKLRTPALAQRVKIAFLNKD